MSERVSMPALGESVTEGTITRWLKSVGDEVEVDEPLVEVSTDKVDTEIPSPVAGTLQEILAEEDDTVEVGADLAVIGDGAGSAGEDSGSDETGEDTEPEPESTDSAADASSQGSSDGDDEQEPSASSESSGADDSTDGEGETVTMPALGESVTEGTITRWLKEEGEQVEVDEPLVEVSTDKVDTEIPSPAAGVLTKILAGEDDTVEVGGNLAVIGGSGSAGPAADDAGSDDTSDADKEDEAGSTEDTQKQSDEAQRPQAPDTGDDDEESMDAEQDTQEEAAERASEKTSSVPAAKDGKASGGTSAAPGTEQDAAADAGSGKSSGSDVSAYVTPLVRKIAAQHDIDLSSLEGTGVGGRIRKQDVLDAAKKAKEATEAADAKPAQQESEPAAPSSSPAPASSTPDVSAKRGQTEKMSRLRKVIATRMVESLQVSAQLTTVVEVDVTKVARLRASHKAEFLEREGVKLSFMPFFALAAVEALKAHPSVNASIDGDQVVYHAQENLGVAVDTERGLLVPVIKDAGDLNIAGLARKINDLAERTRTNKIGPDELGGGTFTLTNTGSRGALFDTPILNQPQVGILGTGSVVRRPVVVVDADGGETIAIRSMVYLALTYDHRLVDGADAARFLSTVKARLEEANFEV